MHAANALLYAGTDRHSVMRGIVTVQIARQPEGWTSFGKRRPAPRRPSVLCKNRKLPGDDGEWSLGTRNIMARA